jgi:hypothetical protein
MGNATSIFNLMRNIGASIGIAMVETMQVRKSQMHLNILGEHVNPANLLARQTMNGSLNRWIDEMRDRALFSSTDRWAPKGLGCDFEHHAQPTEVVCVPG